MNSSVVFVAGGSAGGRGVDVHPSHPGTRWRVSDESVHILEWDFRSQPFVLLFDRAYNWTCQQQFNMMHLFTNSSLGLINHLADPRDAVPPSPQPHLTLGACVRWQPWVSVCVCVSAVRSRFCLSLTPAASAVSPCYLSRQRSPLLADIWSGAEVRPLWIFE